MKPANILFLHQNFPGQYRDLAPALAARGHKVRSLSIRRNAPLDGVASEVYAPTRGTTRQAHPWAQDFETKILRGEACAQAIARMAQGGFVPDIVCANPGWGEAMFVKDVLPDARLHLYLEFFYPTRGGDTGFDPEFAPDSVPARAHARSKRAAQLLSLDAMDSAVSPMRWQRDTFPAVYRDRIATCFDGVDTGIVRPDPAAVLEHEGRTFRAGQPIVTFVSRNLEPYRGYHVFMRALPKLLAEVPDAQVLIVGGDGVSYGAAPRDGVSFRKRFYDEVADRIDQARVHFLGTVPYPTFLKVLQVSAAHAYLTYPFVLSWSMIEAMAAGCLVVGSRTGPVEEVIRDGENGRLVDFFDADELAGTLAKALRDPAGQRSLRERARATAIADYDLAACLARQIELVEG
ncbi:MAG: glycosyltransferase family 4 protein [Rhodospirillales bacterium]|nr:glycosyltransferase family 4 protein [Rhodospirillales bacterium]